MSLRVERKVEHLIYLYFIFPQMPQTAIFRKVELISEALHAQGKVNLWAESCGGTRV